MNLLLLVNAAATLLMTGLIWFVQIVHYPLFRQLPRERCTSYVRLHGKTTSLVVIPVMLTELVTSGLLVLYRPPGLSLLVVSGGLALTLLIWASTFLLQVPCHQRLSLAYDEATIDLLVRSNWARTVLWSLRSLLVLWMLNQVAGDSPG